MKIINMTNIVTGVANIVDQLVLTHGDITFVLKNAKELTTMHMVL